MPNELIIAATSLAASRSLAAEALSSTKLELPSGTTTMLFAVPASVRAYEK